VEARTLFAGLFVNHGLLERGVNVWGGTDDHDAGKGRKEEERNRDELGGVCLYLKPRDREEEW
jgi:hypothetical protein